MRAMLLGLAAPLAALALTAAPAQAQIAGEAGFTAAPGASVQRHDRDGRDSKRHDRRGQRGFPATVVVSDFGSSQGWALYNNRSWSPDSFNDWWHDRPDRAYPRWMQDNRNCERIWWSGGSWRC